MLPDIQTVLCALDLEPGTNEVFRYAVSFASRNGARLVVLHAVRPLGPTATSLLRIHLSAERMKEMRRAWRSRTAAEIRSRVSRFCREELGRREGLEPFPAILVIDGQPAEVILREAGRTRADVIVMGSHGHTAVGEMVLGTTAHKVVLRSAVPVFLVPVTRRSGGGWRG